MADAAARAGVGIEGATRAGSAHRSGRLIFGYAAVHEQAIAEGVDIPARAIGQSYHAPDPLGIDNAARAITLIQAEGEAPCGK